LAVTGHVRLLKKLRWLTHSEPLRRRLSEHVVSRCRAVMNDGICGHQKRNALPSCADRRTHRAALACHQSSNSSVQDGRLKGTAMSTYDEADQRDDVLTPGGQHLQTPS